MVYNLIVLIKKVNNHISRYLQGIINPFSIQADGSRQVYMTTKTRRTKHFGVSFYPAEYWAQQGCAIVQPLDMEVGAGTFTHKLSYVL